MSETADPQFLARTRRRDLRLLALLRGVSFLGDSVALVTLYLRLAPQGHAWEIAALSIAGALPLARSYDAEPARYRSSTGKTGRFCR